MSGPQIQAMHYPNKSVAAVATALSRAKARAVEKGLSKPPESKCMFYHFIYFGLTLFSAWIVEST